MQPGYNPSASLLPSGGGAIQAMSGGGMGGMPPTPGYNSSESLLPRAGGDLPAYKGGFFAEDAVQLIGGNDPPAPPAATGTQPSPPAAAEASSTPQNAPTPLAAATAAAQPATSAASLPPAAVPVGANSNTKAIMLFGKTINVEDPKTIKPGVFTSAQKEALATFGLDGPGLSDPKKKDILVSLYEGQCNSDKGLIFHVNCEPMREIVQSLALNLLGKLKEKGEDGVINDAGNPEVTAEMIDNGKKFRVYIDFTPAQMPLLSKYKVDDFVKNKRTNIRNNKAAATASATPSAAPPAAPTAAATPKPGQKMMEIKPQDITKGGSDVITALGIENPDIWCYAIAGIQFMFSIPQMRDEFSNLDCSKPLSIPSEKDDIRALPAIEPKDALCALKWAFGELSQNTTKFSDSDYASKIAGNKTIPINTPVLYIMRKFLLEQMKSDDKATGDTKKQQDVAEFLRIIFDMIDNEPTIKKVLDRFRFKVNKKYECENTAIKKESTKPDPALFLELYTDAYTKNSSPELQNKKKNDVGGLSLQNLIDYYSRNQVPITSSTNPEREMIDGCGEGGVGKGHGTYSEQISLDDTNDYLIINPIKATDSGRPSWQDTSVKIKAEALITVAENAYTIFGAILYSGSGVGGHYVYQRLYADGTSDINADTDINKLPFIMYNTGETTANDAQSYTILDNATLIIYKRVRGGAAAEAASRSNSKEEMTNADKIDNQLTEDEKRNMSITSNRVQQIAEATGLTVAKVSEILEAKEIQERGGAAAATSPGAEAPAGTAAESPDAPAEAGPPEVPRADPPAAAAEAAVPATEEADEEGSEEEASAEAVSGAVPPATEEGMAETGAAAPSGNNQRGQGAPVKYSNNLSRAREAAVKQAKEKELYKAALKKKTENLTQNNKAILAKYKQQRNSAAANTAKEARNLAAAKPTVENGEQEENVLENNSDLTDAEKQAKKAIYGSIEQEKVQQASITRIEEILDKLKARLAVQNGIIAATSSTNKQRSNASEAKSRIASHIVTQGENLEDAKRKLTALSKQREKLQTAYPAVLTPADKEKIKAEMAEISAASAPSSGSVRGGSKRRKTNKHKTKTFKKRQSKKRSTKTFKRRK
jgi:hypothetical protein